jgi:hypothetical protein
LWMKSSHNSLSPLIVMMSFMNTVILRMYLKFTVICKAYDKNTVWRLERLASVIQEYVFVIQAYRIRRKRDLSCTTVLRFCLTVIRSWYYKNTFLSDCHTEPSNHCSVCNGFLGTIMMGCFRADSVLRLLGSG